MSAKPRQLNQARFRGSRQAKVDISWFTVSDEAKDAMHSKFVEALKGGCAADKDALLAGVIDGVVAKALSETHTEQ